MISHDWSNLVMIVGNLAPYNQLLNLTNKRQNLTIIEDKKSTKQSIV